MNTITRNGKRWTVNECIQLQREFELLELSRSVSDKLQALDGIFQNMISI